MAFNFEKFFFSQLPLYFKINDTYKDNNDRGLLERYLEIFGLELDEIEANGGLVENINNYLRIISPLETDAKFLTTLGFTLGSPPDLLNDNTKYAKLLAYIMSFYKIKGTAKSFELLFALLGFLVNIIEFPPSEATLLDNGNILDEDNLELETFDTGCPSCSEYEISINELLTTPGVCPAPTLTVIDNTILATFIKIIEFNQPINARLAKLINGGTLCEEVNLCIVSIINLDTFLVIALDNSLILDDGKSMDDYTIISSEVVSEGCDGNPLPLAGIGFMEVEDDFEVA